MKNKIIIKKHPLVNKVPGRFFILTFWVRDGPSRAHQTAHQSFLSLWMMLTRTCSPPRAICSPAESRHTSMKWPFWPSMHWCRPGTTREGERTEGWTETLIHSGWKDKLSKNTIVLQNNLFNMSPELRIYRPKLLIEGKQEPKNSK